MFLLSDVAGCCKGWANRMTAGQDIWTEAGLILSVRKVLLAGTEPNQAHNGAEVQTNSRQLVAVALIATDCNWQCC